MKESMGKGFAGGADSCGAADISEQQVMNNGSLRARPEGVRGFESHLLHSLFFKSSHKKKGMKKIQMIA